MNFDTIVHGDSGWGRMERVLLSALMVFLACTTAFDGVIMELARLRPAAVVFVGLMIVAQSLTMWLYFMRVVPVLKRDAPKFPTSVQACAALFTVGVLVSSAVAGIGIYLLLNNRPLHG